MTIKEFLERDKERFMQRLSQASGADRVIQVCEEELNRILLQYNEANPDKKTGEEAYYAMQTARAALPLLDSMGEPRIFNRHLPAAETKTSPKGLVPFTAGAACTAGGALLLAFGNGVLGAVTLLPLSVLLFGAGLLGAFWAGRKSAAPMPQVPGEVFAEAETDSEKVYHSLSMLLNVVDHNLEDVRQKSAMGISENGLPGLESHGASPIKKDELDLMAGILESAYSRIDESYARDMISEIRFYLHRHGIELIEYGPDTAAFFDLVPAPSDRTIRPAMKSGTVLLTRGLAGIC